MGKRLGSFNKFVFLINVLFALLLLLACIGSYFSWKLFSFLAPLSLIAPYLVFANLAFFLFWTVKKRKQLLLSFSVLLVGYLSQGKIIKFFNSTAVVEDGAISLMTFNSHGNMGVRWSRNPIYKNEIIDFVRKENPDIVCFQEYSRTNDIKLKQYPYKYQTPFYSGKSRQAIFSKYKIIETGSLNFPNSSNNALYADIIIKRDTFRIYNLHLQSLVVRAGSFKREQPQRLLKRLSKTIEKQQEQSKLVQWHSKTVNYKKIICGDFNNTQFSNVYRTIRGDMNDTFLEKGFGLGSTYIFKFLPFRIDFILADPEIEIKSHKNFDIRLSDHTPIMASFRLKE